MTDENVMVLSTDQLWTILSEYVHYTSLHNQTSDPEQLISSARQDKQVYYSLLRSLLTYMSKHGLPRQFPSDGSIFLPTEKIENSSQSVCETVELTDEEESALDASTFWLEEVAQTAVGVLGVLGNLVAISVYFAGGKKFLTIFYRLLICLLFTHTGYIILTLTSFFGRKMAL
jgi:hypothetical protein